MHVHQAPTILVKIFFVILVGPPGCLNAVPRWTMATQLRLLHSVGPLQRPCQQQLC